MSVEIDSDPAFPCLERSSQLNRPPFGGPTKKDSTVKTSAPTQPVLIIAVILFILSLLAYFAVVPVPAPAFWLASAAFVVLLFGNLFKGW